MKLGLFTGSVREVGLAQVGLQCPVPPKIKGLADRFEHERASAVLLRRSVWQPHRNL